jgi:hypothetical protein
VENLDDLCLNVPVAAGLALVKTIDDDAWELKEQEPDPRSPLAQLLASVIDGLRPSLSQWNYFPPHVDEEDIARWLSDESIPTGAQLSRLFCWALDWFGAGDGLLWSFRKIACLPATDVSPHGHQMRPTLRYHMWPALSAYIPLPEGEEEREKEFVEKIRRPVAADSEVDEYWVERNYACPYLCPACHADLQNPVDGEVLPCRCCEAEPQQHSLFARTLEAMLDSCFDALSYRLTWCARWAGVRESVLVRWFNDEDIPSPHQLAALYCLAELRGGESLEAFRAVMLRPSAEVSPWGERMAPTVWDYLRPAKDEWERTSALFLCPDCHAALRGPINDEVQTCPWCGSLRAPSECEQVDSDDPRLKRPSKGHGGVWLPAD